MAALKYPFQGKNLQDLYISIMAGKVKNISNRYSTELF